MKNRRLLLAMAVIIIIIVATAVLYYSWFYGRPERPSVNLTDIVATPIGFLNAKNETWHPTLVLNVTNNADADVHIPWIDGTFTNVTYKDNSFEELDIHSNTTANYVISPGESKQILLELSSFGLTLEPKIVSFILLIRVQEANGTLTLSGKAEVAS